MADSIFRKKVGREVVVSFMLIDELADLHEKLGGIEEGWTTEKSLTLIKLAFRNIGREHLATDELASVVDKRLQAYSEAAAKSQEAKKVGGKRVFGQYYLEWFEKLSNEGVCLYCAEYDLDKAEKYYTEHDFTDVFSLAINKYSRETELNRVYWEAALFGFGGGYQEKSSAEQPASDSDWVENVEGLKDFLTI
jgi:hypothetical protein